MFNSMTAFSSLRGGGAGLTWVWDIRSVNGKGFDVRMRLPESVMALEAALSTQVAAAVQRGTVTLNLKITRENSAPSYVLNPAALAHALAHIAQIDTAAKQAGIVLSTASPVDIIGLRGVLEAANPEDHTPDISTALLADAAVLICDCCKMRADEGRLLAAIINDQVDQIAQLLEAARALLPRRSAEMAAHLQTQLQQVLDGAQGADPHRVAQELALISVKYDITEELDRLSAHVTAARALLASTGPVGRKFDFLTQEFNREANTLCSKSNMTELTRIGLDLKVVIDQMREQVQNVE